MLELDKRRKIEEELARVLEKLQVGEMNIIKIIKQIIKLHEKAIASSAQGHKQRN
jgi:hypothetical protein